MIPATRFIAQSDDRDTWLAARATGVTATTVAKAATPQGFTDAINDITNPTHLEPNAVMQFGTNNENWIALELKRTHGTLPNHWLIAANNEPRFMATPDTLNVEHTLIGEIKTGGKWDGRIPIAHRRQMQWQMLCTDTEACVYAFILRTEVDGTYVPAWFEPYTETVERDPKMIAALTDTAHRLLTEKENRS